MQRRPMLNVALLAAAIVTCLGTFEAQARRWGEGYFPNLPVVTQDGKTLRFFDDVLKGKIVVVNFIYTSCPDICGLTTARLAQVEERLGDAMGRDIFFVSLTVDPEHDTPKKLKEYAKSFRSGPGWLFLTGKPEDIRAINAKFGERTTSLDQHRQEVLLGNVPSGHWARNSVLGDIERFIVDVREMDPKWMARNHTAARRADMDTGRQLSSEPGQVLFKRLCAGCHTIGKGDRAGPDLQNVTSRRERSWLTRFIMNPYRMRAEGDPTALALFAKYRGALMPRLGISKNDAGDLITYMDAQTARLSPKQQALSQQPQAVHQKQHVLPQTPASEIGGPFKLIDHHGMQVTERDFLGKPTLVFFGFTNCPDVCPTTLFELSNRLKGLGPDADRLNVLFVTVDPERDTPKQLALYLSSFDPRITGLSGTSENIAAAIKAFKVYIHKTPLSDGGYTMDHTASVFMMDTRWRFAGTINHRDLSTKASAQLRHLLDSALPAQTTGRAPPAGSADINGR